MIKTSHHEDEMARRAGLWPPLPARLKSSAALTCRGGIWTGPPGMAPALSGDGKWPGLAAAVVLASDPPLHVFSRKLLWSTPSVPGIMPGAWVQCCQSRHSPCPHQACGVEEETVVDPTLASVKSSL